ncbi:MAG: DUF5615 family PIN-like protein [Acidimicrobiia bacterium]
MAPPAGSPRRLRFLLDAHHSPLIARALGSDGHDVVAAATNPAFARLEDDELLRAASRDDRALVTENARAFDRIVRAWAACGDHHIGVVFTSPRRYHRGSAAYPASLISALGDLLADVPREQTDWVRWLP